MASMKDKWFSYDPIENEILFHDSEDDARQEVEKTLEWCRDYALSDGWPDEVDTICWGKVVGYVKELYRKPAHQHADYDEEVEYGIAFTRDKQSA